MKALLLTMVFSVLSLCVPTFAQQDTQIESNEPEEMQIDTIPPFDLFPGIEEGKPRLLLFVMAHCPHSIAAETLIIQSWEKNKSEYSLEIHYLVGRDDLGQFVSPLGTADLDEAIEQLAVRYYYPDKYWDYVQCRARMIYDRDFWVCIDEMEINRDEFIKRLNADNIFLARESFYTQEFMATEAPTAFWINKIGNNISPMDTLLGLSKPKCKMKE